MIVTRYELSVDEHHPLRVEIISQFTTLHTSHHTLLSINYHTNYIQTDLIQENRNVDTNEGKMCGSTYPSV